MSNKKHTKKGSLLIVLAVYVAAFVIGAAVFWICRGMGMGILVSTLVADIIGTLVVWGTGLAFRNASLYDPYWSVIPVLIIPFWVIIKETGTGVMDILLIVAVSLWGIRLTMNWILGWKGLGHQDWRYTMLKEKNPDIWFITNLGGINMMPTLLVFLGMVPAFYMINSSQRFNILGLLGFLICIGATALQLFSDRQMALFRKDPGNSGKNIREGLWKYSRHPNYLGEVSLWWGIWLMQMGAAPSIWWTIAGPVAMTILFVFISIPMMEKYVSAKRPGYAEYKKTVPMLLPIKLFKK